MMLSLRVLSLQDSIEAYRLQTALLFNHKEEIRQRKGSPFSYLKSQFQGVRGSGNDAAFPCKKREVIQSP